MSTIPNVVYKYASYETFGKIIDSGNLWLTDIQESNDKSELKIAFGIIKDVFLEEYEKDNPRYMERYFPRSKFEEFYQNEVRHINAIENIIHTQYVTCFSSKGDLLSQWNGYGDAGCGVSIGFNTEIFNNAGDDYKFDKVEYTPRMQKAMVRNEVCSSIKSIRKFVKRNGTIEGIDNREFQIVYNTLLLKYAPFMKNHFFYEEKEWRLCYWYSKSLDHKDFAFKNGDIKQIIIGPKCPKNKDEIKATLSKAGINSDIIYSEGHGIYVDSKNHRVSKERTEKRR